MKVQPILTQTARNLSQTFGSQVMTLITVSLSVLIFSFFFLVYFNLQRAGIQLGEYIKIIVYLDEEPSPTDKPLLEKKIREFAPVEKVVFKSKEEAFAQLRHHLGPDQDLLADLKPDFLPPSIEVYPARSLTALTRINQFSDFLATLPKAKKVQYGREWIERLASFTQLVRLIVYLSGGLLVLTSTFMVSSTIRLTVVTRQAELEILRLLGADSAYIKTPLFLEGLLQGVLGSGLGLLCLYTLFTWVQRRFAGQSILDLVAFTFLPGTMVTAIFTASILLCTLGSLISIRKFLRV
jgi:cell division transport system permease protein